MNNNIFIFGTFRSGSTLLSKILENSLSSSGYHSLEEYFGVDISLDTYFLEGKSVFREDIRNDKTGEIKNNPLLKKEIILEKDGEPAYILTSDRTLWPKNNITYKTEWDRRFQLLKNTKKKYIIRIFPNHIPKKELITFINDNANLILLERKNKISQLLSYAIACSTKQFVTYNTINYEPDSIELYEPSFETFTNQLHFWNEYKSKFFNNCLHLYYEDIIDKKNIDIYGNNIIIENSKNIPVKILAEDPFTFIKNKKEVEGWLKKYNF